MFCSSCGTQVDNNAQFCPNCGTKFIQIPTSTEGSAPLPLPHPQTPITTSLPAAGISAKASSRAITALVFGILGIVCCQPIGIAGWIIGASELKKIKSGLSSEEGKAYATAGMIMGIISTTIFTMVMVVSIIWLIFLLVMTTIYKVPS
ncbi:MAG: DUF4190 domain-containing protein [bacterium]|nr:DUF4190 domain-containing protein [bacterium]